MKEEVDKREFREMETQALKAGFRRKMGWHPPRPAPTLNDDAGAIPRLGKRKTSGALLCTGGQVEKLDAADCQPHDQYRH